MIVAYLGDETLRIDLRFRTVASCSMIDCLVWSEMLKHFVHIGSLSEIKPYESFNCNYICENIKYVFF